MMCSIATRPSALRERISPASSPGLRLTGSLSPSGSVERSLPVSGLSDGRAVALVEAVHARFERSMCAHLRKRYERLCYADVAGCWNGTLLAFWRSLRAGGLPEHADLTAYLPFLLKVMKRQGAARLRWLFEFAGADDGHGVLVGLADQARYRRARRIESALGDVEAVIGTIPARQREAVSALAEALDLDPGFHGRAQAVAASMGMRPDSASRLVGEARASLAGGLERIGWRGLDGKPIRWEYATKVSVRDDRKKCHRRRPRFDKIPLTATCPPITLPLAKSTKSDNVY